ncbi:MULTISPECIES: sugar phosphatase [Edwardsiella]|uniref:HAD-superfamily hydrolase n=2 Tax=Edwardsiella anguillarum TaxID=1821960 RepID=A0A076LJY2_9GAMM|nr:MULTISPECIES: sugar phosphatase [Edwardsiella]AKM47335.1 phosphatase [Edwardsiella sp. EA181011]GAJ66002.1 HAD-superfamily hydrolase [Edwardsiella piscicida]AIJ06898.1 HAD-superfamily hydrolase [Edwardsiella anguillarum ET080813]AKR78336.1 sugar phosphatase [Edwardsiella sp. LADL05-105]KAB0593486.1 sugar phosphatase [Edwardsiella anguillarum]
MKCKGFLFDLDGTLVDSLPVVERSWINWAKRQGINPQQVLEFIHGKQAITSLRHFMPDADEARLQEEFDWLEALESRDTDGIVAMPGAAALIARLDALEIPWGIVTSGSVPVAYARCKAAGLPKPAVFITAEQVQRGKPEPDAYLLGAQRLELAPGACAVVEDAPAGILAGLTAGCQVIAVNAPAETPKLDKVTLVLRSLALIAVTRVGDEAEIALVQD